MEYSATPLTGNEINYPLCVRVHVQILSIIICLLSTYTHVNIVLNRCMSCNHIAFMRWWLVYLYSRLDWDA